MGATSHKVHGGLFPPPNIRTQSICRVAPDARGERGNQSAGSDRGPAAGANRHVGGRDYDLTEATKERLGFPSTGALLASR